MGQLTPFFESSPNLVENRERLAFSCNLLTLRRSYPDSKLSPERFAQLRKVSIPFDTPEATLDVEQCNGKPAVFLARIAPGIDLGTSFLHQGVDRFNTVRGLERLAQNGVDTQSVKREGFF